MNVALPEGSGPSGTATRRLAVGRLVHKVDFERLLGIPGHCRSAHFALHHVNAVPHRPSRSSKSTSDAKLSTALSPDVPRSVDNFVAGHWLGVVVPKRHARRAVTRSLLKRQMRSVVQVHAAALPPGLWLLRLRQPFASGQFPAAASLALARAVRQELVLLLERATRAVPTAATDSR